MRERAAELGGTLAAGPTAGRLARRAASAARRGNISDMIRVLVADDQALVREGLMTLLDAAPGIEPVAAARDGAGGGGAVRRAPSRCRADGSADAERGRRGGDASDPRRRIPRSRSWC